MIRKFFLLHFFAQIIIAQTEPVKDIHENNPRVWALSNALVHTEPGDSIKEATKDWFLYLGKN